VNKGKPVEVFGLPETTDMLANVLPREATNISRRAATGIAAEVRNDIRTKAPKRTGNLKKSIKSKRDRGKKGQVSASVYVDRSGGKSGRGYHWHLVEFGARGGNMPAQPFVVPTVEQWRPKMRTLYRERVGVELERELVKRAKKAARV